MYLKVLCTWEAINVNKDYDLAITFYVFDTISKKVHVWTPRVVMIHVMFLQL